MNLSPVINVGFRLEFRYSVLAHTDGMKPRISSLLEALGEHKHPPVISVLFRSVKLRIYNSRLLRQAMAIQPIKILLLHLFIFAFLKAIVKQLCHELGQKVDNIKSSFNKKKRVFTVHNPV